MGFKIKDRAWTLNNYRNRATPVDVTDVTPEHVEVWNRFKKEAQFFHPTTGLALGTAWEDEASRPMLVPEDDELATTLEYARLHRRHADAMREAVNAAAKAPSPETFSEMRTEILRWAGHTLPVPSNVAANPELLK